ncbi:STAS domain-containing protein [Aneurinibacillus sp. Ricciae_BoGa-3]|uniref:STAS domain-containing protein n=1 Tax=Aneurinibacillus sp. Ricciae_BoGa-3 TaxID=3022697 RepID=UPI0023421E59|nr:STAS domain-containing protein [Aneurinibacillus sp. Ricciae_BoGa-3]WCK55106.1 STAS domain-containing protein [Aneurinibacillus sp. Ricciae_BoGa-3]
MNLVFKEGQDVKEFLLENRESFEDKLLSEAENVRDKIEEIQLTGNIDLLSNAHKVVLYVVGYQEENLVAFAKQEGISWAKHSLTLALKLEWVHAIRRTLWNFLYRYDQLSHKSVSHDDFYSLEKKINEQIDQFLNNFFISYSKFKDELLDAQKRLVENLSVPIIPVSSRICVLPLIGDIDCYRIAMIEEKVLMEIAKSQIHILMMDLSGISEMAPAIANQLLRIIDGISMMGAEAVITGLRPEVVREMIREGISFTGTARLKGTLQQALNDYLVLPLNS